MRNFIVLMLIAFGSLFIIELVPAQELSKGTGSIVSSVEKLSDQDQKNRYDLVIIQSKSIIPESIDEDTLRYFKNADASFSKNITHKLQEHGLASRPTGSDFKTEEHQHLLTYRIEKLEFGFKNPIGRHTKMKVSYAFQKKQGGALTSGEFEEQSKKGWKNCVKTISAKIAEDVSDVLAGIEKPGAGQ